MADGSGGFESAVALTEHFTAIVPGKGELTPAQLVHSGVLGGAALALELKGAAHRAAGKGSDAQRPFQRSRLTGVPYDTPHGGQQFDSLA